MIVILTEHAKIRMAAKAINLDQIKRVLVQGAKIKQTDGFLATHADLEVAYKIRGERYIIKTVKVR